MKVTWRRMLALLLAFAFVAAACSGDVGDDEAVETETEETTEAEEADEEEANAGDGVGFRSCGSTPINS